MPGASALVAHQEGLFSVDGPSCHSPIHDPTEHAKLCLKTGDQTWSSQVLDQARYSISFLPSSDPDHIVLSGAFCHQYFYVVETTRSTLYLFQQTPGDRDDQFRLCIPNQIYV